MAGVLVEKNDEVPVQDPGQSRRVTVIFQCNDKRTINQISREFFGFVEKYDANRRKPIILPTAETPLTTRKSPCGNGTASFTRYKLRVFQRVFKLDVFDKDFGSIVSYLKNSLATVQLKVE